MMMDYHVEPEYYVPIIPMVFSIMVWLVLELDGVLTLPQYNPIDIIKNIKETNNQNYKEISIL